MGNRATLNLAICGQKSFYNPFLKEVSANYTNFVKSNIKLL